MMNSCNFEIKKKGMYSMMWSAMDAKKGNNEFLSCLDYMWVNYPTKRGQATVACDGANTNITQNFLKYCYWRCSDFSQQRMFERITAMIMPQGHNYQDNDRLAWEAERSWSASNRGFATVAEKVKFLE